MNINKLLSGVLMSFACLVLMVQCVLADGWKGSHKAKGRDRYPIENSDVIGFTSRDRVLISNYYSRHGVERHCPPGLAKKGTGCQPPGQAKKWALYQPLPYEVDYYPLPRDLLIRLPMPPRGYRYVRVASDVLMIATGTAMVADALEDIIR